MIKPTGGDATRTPDSDYKVSEKTTEMRPSTHTKEAIDSDDWDTDPDNPRLWTPSKKWLAMSIVRHTLSLGPCQSQLTLSRFPSIPSYPLSPAP